MRKITLLISLIVTQAFVSRAQTTAATPSTAPTVNALPAAGIHGVAPEHRYFRAIALVHLVGSGKPTDPVRPEFVPFGVIKAAAVALSPSAAAQPGALRPGILAWSVLPTDDKKMAIVHLVAADPHAFDEIKGSTLPDIQIFEIGKHSKNEIETALKKVKKDFDLEKFQVVAQ